MNIGFFVNTRKSNAPALVAEVTEWLKKRDVIPLLPDEQAEKLGFAKTGLNTDAIVERSDVLLVLGGDGTLLSAAHTPGIEKVPILAINLGTLGFLTDAPLDELYPALKATLNKDYRIEHRMMLEVVVNGAFSEEASKRASGLPGMEEAIDVERGHDKPFQAFALNDVVLRHYTHLIELEAYIDDEFFIPYHADGLIIATPSGSTGYSLSCGSAIVAPQVKAMLMTPIAPHSLTIRPFIAHSDAEIRVKMRSADGNVDVFVDGQREIHPLGTEAIINVRKAERTIQLIRSLHHSYYGVLREKLMLGESRKGSGIHTTLHCR